MKTLRGLWIKDSQPKIWLCVLLLMLHRKDLDDCLFAAFIHCCLQLKVFLCFYRAILQQPLFYTSGARFTNIQVRMGSSAVVFA